MLDFGKIKVFMVKFLESILTETFDKFLTFRHWMKLNIYKSPMTEYPSLNYSLYKFKAQILFKIKNKSHKFRFKKEANEFNEKGFATFSNKLIEKNSFRILEKIADIEDPWDQKDYLKVSASQEFKKEFISIFENGVDDFIKSAFKSDYKIFFHQLYKSKRYSKDEVPELSALWHADGGPGICMNLMICHTPVNKLNGAMKVIPWNYSKEMLTKTFYNYKKWTRSQNKLSLDKYSRLEKRSIKCTSLKNIIEEKSIKYFQPNTQNPGLIYAFKNNCVHAGGFTELNQERIVSVMHIYPSMEKTSIIDKFNSEHRKKAPFPRKLK